MCQSRGKANRSTFPTKQLFIKNDTNKRTKMVIQQKCSCTFIALLLPLHVSAALKKWFRTALAHGNKLRHDRCWPAFTTLSKMCLLMCLTKKRSVMQHTNIICDTKSSRKRTTHPTVAQSCETRYSSPERDADLGQQYIAQYNYRPYLHSSFSLLTRAIQLLQQSILFTKS